MSSTTPIFLVKPLADYPRVPLQSYSGTTDRRVLALGSDFKDYVVVDLMIFNLDSINQLRVIVNNVMDMVVGAMGFIAFNNIICEKVEVIPNAFTGNWQIHPFGISREIIQRKVS